VALDAPEDELPPHRLDLVFRDDTAGLIGAVLLRSGNEIPLQSLTFSGTELRLQLRPPDFAPDTEMPFLVMTPAGDRFEGRWNSPETADIPLKLVRMSASATGDRAADRLADDPTRAPAPAEAALAPLLSVRGGAMAVEFYKAAFGAVEVYRVEAPDGAVVSRLQVGGAEFWVSDESPAHGNFSPPSLGGGTVRMILTVADPDAFFARTLTAGAREVTPMENNYGWRVGRMVDPFGHHWEIGRPLEA
jgi:PhnB protein